MTQTDSVTLAVPCKPLSKEFRLGKNNKKFDTKQSIQKTAAF